MGFTLKAILLWLPFLLYIGFWVTIVILLIKLIKGTIRWGKRTDRSLSEISETLAEMKDELKELKQKTS